MLARDIATEQKVKDILREPVELIDQDLDEVAGGFFNINNFDSNQGVQGLGVGAFNNQDSNLRYLTHPRRHHREQKD